ncbi:hypothetical protein [Emticicia sp. BO119]|uniref:hypothetical protein n=1 Tax=Emticicia sp. BO119 TaxID=2757768 RepID=UPI0015F01E00|nr:hypothetical protein [Emticicia sp. BO119]MBA4851466.1 hypothetical protein [Emticicia sp. BO119]
MKKLLCIFLILASCTPNKVERKDLTLKNGFYYKNDNLFTGKVIFRRSDNSISYAMNLVNGVPEGKSESFGYIEDVIQVENYSTIQNPTIQKQLNLIRISKDVFIEGDLLIGHYIHLITNEDSVQLKRFDKAYVITLLKPILDEKVENHIIFSKGELEESTLEFEEF